MSNFSDDGCEMLHNRPIDDTTAEAVIRGGVPGRDDLRPLAEAIGIIRQHAAGPAPEPTVVLARMLAMGSSYDKGDLPVTAASNVSGPAQQASELPNRRKKMAISQFIAGLSLAGKITLGAGFAAAAAGGAAATGSLPDPIQHAVARAVDVVTPFEVPDPNHHDFGGGAPVTSNVVDKPESTESSNESSTTVTTQVLGGAVDSSSTSSTSTTNFGEAVSAQAHDATPGVDGQTISSEAKSKNDAVPCEARAKHTDDGKPTESTEPDHTTTTVTAPGAPPTSGPGKPGAGASTCPPSGGDETSTSTPSGSTATTEKPNDSGKPAGTPGKPAGTGDEAHSSTSTSEPGEVGSGVVSSTPAGGSLPVTIPEASGKQPDPESSTSVPVSNSPSIPDTTQLDSHGGHGDKP